MLLPETVFLFILSMLQVFALLNYLLSFRVQIFSPPCMPGSSPGS